MFLFLQIDLVQSGIQSTILVRDKETPTDIHVNFDPEIFTLIREADLMLKMDLEVPEKAQMLLRKQYYYLDLFTQVENMLTRNNELRLDLCSLLFEFVPRCRLLSSLGSQAETTSTQTPPRQLSTRGETRLLTYQN